LARKPESQTILGGLNVKGIILKLDLKEKEHGTGFIWVRVQWPTVVNKIMNPQVI
jgi:hypothetical protein